MRSEETLNEPTRRVPVDTLRQLIEDILSAGGCDAANARAAAAGYLEADLRGHSIQGLDHLFSTVAWLKSGVVNPVAQPRVVRETASSAVVDGDKGLGQVGAALAVETAARKAVETGCSVVGCINTDDIFMLGYYAEQLTRHDLVGFVMTNGYPCFVHPHGGVEPLLGTNPLAIGVPSGGVYPIVLDMATSASAIGHVRIASYTDRTIPEGIAVDSAGSPTTDPKAVLDGGALSPLGEHKGFGLGLCVALLSGPVIGAAIGQKLEEAFENPDETDAVRGHLFVAFDLSAFGAADVAKHAIGSYVEEMKNSRRAPGVDEILMPGERGLRRREDSLKNGALILESVWEKTRKLANELGVAMPD